MPDKKGKEGGFAKFLYNSETGEVLGRTGMSWAKITIFYIFFYAALLLFFLACLYVFYLTLTTDRPKYLTKDGLIGDNPGVGFRPQPDQDKNVDSTLIWYSKSAPREVDFWASQLKTYLEDTKAAAKDGASNCTYGEKRKKSDKPCMMDVSRDSLGPCADENFGYDKGEPCILIKLNRIYGWEPEVLTSKQKSPKDFDADEEKEFLKYIAEPKFPNQLSQYITTQMQRLDEKKKFEFAKSVWIHCRGENPADRENLGGIEYFPMPGIPSYYFPFQRQENYRSPFVMVKFNKVVPGVLINVECRAYSQNIKYDRQLRKGSVHFEMMID